MTKFLTAAAWSALVLGGAAVADTPPAEVDVAAEDATTEALTEIATTSSYDEDVEAEGETAGAQDGGDAEGDDETAFDASEETDIVEADESESE